MDLNAKNDVEAIEAFVDKYKQLRQEIALCDVGVLLLRFDGNTLESLCIGKDSCGF